MPELASLRKSIKRRGDCMSCSSLNSLVDVKADAMHGAGCVRDHVKTRTFTMRRDVATIGWIFLLPLLIGCAGFQIGQRSLYRSDVRTVHVPIFESDSFRRNMGERLTEAVVREIELKTPYKVVSAARADSHLRGRIVAESKNVIAEDAFDVPRIIETNMVVNVAWEKNDGELLSTNARIPVPFALGIGEANQMIPEGGQSVVTSHQQVIDRLARHIVAQMEMPW